MHQRSLNEAKRILETHKSEALVDDVKAGLRAIVEEIEDHLGVKRSTFQF